MTQAQLRVDIELSFPTMTVTRGACFKGVGHSTCLHIFNCVLLIALLMCPARNLWPQTTLDVDCTHIIGYREPHISEGDLLHVTIFLAPEMEQHVRVSTDGNVTLTLIGALHLSGMDTAEAGKAIHQSLKDGHFIRDAMVDLSIEQYGDESVVVGGQVVHPGMYPLDKEVDLLTVLSMAGGTSALAGETVAIRSRNVGARAVCARALDRQGTLIADEATVIPGDSVEVSRSAIAYVLGNVDHPGAFAIPPHGLTALKAIASASGLGEHRKHERLRLIRRTAAGFIETTSDLTRIEAGKEQDPQLENEDVVYVDTDTRGTVHLDAQQIMASLSRISSFPIQP